MSTRTRPVALLNGTAAGLLATLAMTPVMLAARRAGLVPRPAPETVTTNALGRLGAAGDVRPPARTVVASMAHLAFGAGAGALYGLLAPRRRVAGAAAGTLYGIGVWAVSYLGWLPALRLVPPPTHHRDGRLAETFAGHLVYGSVLGALSARSR